MTIEQTVDIPPSRRVFFDLPAGVPEGRARIKLSIMKPRGAAAKPDAPPAPLTEAEMASGVDCPLCKYYGHKFNAETIAAIEEGDAMIRGEIPDHLYNSVAELLADLKKE